MNLDDSLKSVTRHAKYYIKGADISFQVEHIVFRVHRYFFERESPFFTGRLSTPASPGAQPRGVVDSNAILLDDVTSEQFAMFLWVFYNPRYSLYDAPVESWSVILRLANKWHFPEVKALTIRELELKVMSDVTRVKLYQENDVDKNFFIPHYAALCEREEPLTYEEGLELGIQTAMMIAAGRERVRQAHSPNGVIRPLIPTVHGSDLHGVIRQLFNMEATDTSDSSVNEEAPLKESGGLRTPPAQQETNQPKGKATPTTGKRAKGANDQNQKLTSKHQTTSSEAVPAAVGKAATEAEAKKTRVKDDKPSVTTETTPPTNSNKNAPNPPPVTPPTIPFPVVDQNSTTEPPSIFGSLDNWAG